MFSFCKIFIYRALLHLLDPNMKLSKVEIKTSEKNKEKTIWFFLFSSMLLFMYSDLKFILFTALWHILPWRYNGLTFLFQFFCCNSDIMFRLLFYERICSVSLQRRRILFLQYFLWLWFALKIKTRLFYIFWFLKKKSQPFFLQPLYILWRYNADFYKKGVMLAL